MRLIHEMKSNQSVVNSFSPVPRSLKNYQQERTYLTYKIYISHAFARLPRYTNPDIKSKKKHRMLVGTPEATMKSSATKHERDRIHFPTTNNVYKGIPLQNNMNAVTKIDG